MLKVIVNALPDALCTVVPSPQFTCRKELLNGECVKIFYDISGGNFIKITIAERSERTLPNRGGVLAMVEL